jgi:hypothetical protein
MTAIPPKCWSVIGACRRKARIPIGPSRSSGRFDSFKSDRTRIDLLLFGDCEIQMEADFLRQDAARRNIDLRVAATFASDVSLAGERKCDAVIVGALNARKALPTSRSNGPGILCDRNARAHRSIARAAPTRRFSSTICPNRRCSPKALRIAASTAIATGFVKTNLALAAMVEEFSGVYLIDVAAALAAAGTARLLDDG